MSEPLSHPILEPNKKLLVFCEKIKALKEKEERDLKNSTGTSAHLEKINEEELTDEDREMFEAVEGASATTEQLQQYAVQFQNESDKPSEWTSRHRFAQFVVNLKIRKEWERVKDQLP